ncbi:MAG: thioredoxin family protein [Flavobacteriales bacterium]|nr:thioredoxin family protein [Flavobacteriales bacterium]
MARTYTTQIPLGYKAPHFALPEVMQGKEIHYRDIRGPKGTVVMFICNHCPYVIHVREALVKLANDYKDRGVGFVAISSNDVENYPQDGPMEMAAMAEELNFPFHYLYDESQEAAKAYDAACTPDFSVFDADDNCVYRGELDASRPGSGIPVTGEAMREVLDLLEKGKVVPAEGQRPSMGCNIKWKE